MTVGYFNDDGKLKRVSLRDGRVVTLAAAPLMRGGAWTDDDFIYFTPNSTFGMDVWQIAAKGGAPEAVTKPKSGRDYTSHRWPPMVPGAKTLLFTIWGAVGFDNARAFVWSRSFVRQG
jgi:hypothetical protein